MKRFLSFVLSIIFALQLSAQTTITIGDSTSTLQTSFAPVSYAYKNSYSQTIYPSSALISGGIVSMSYYCNAINATPEGTIKIYMAEVSNSNITNFVSGVDFVEVYSGPIQWVLGWNQITFTTPFVYTGTGNLLIATIRDGETYSISNYYKASFAPNSVVYHYADNIEYDVNNNHSGTSNHNRPVIKLTIADLDSYCHPVTNLTFDTESITTTSATVSWDILDESSTTFGLAYKTDSPSSTWTTLSTNITEHSYTLTDLNPYTRYQVKVWTVCGLTNSEAEQTEIVTLPTEEFLTSIPYFQDFDDLTSISEWYFSNHGVNQWHIGTAVDNTTIEEDGSALYISNDNGATNNYTNNSISVSHAYTLIETIADSYYGISFDVKLHGESTPYETDYLTVSLVPIAEKLSANMPSSNRVIGKVLTTNNQWERITLPFPQDIEPSYYQLAFSWRNNEENGQSPAVAVDNINLFSTPCARVNEFNVTMEDAGESVNMSVAIIDSLNENATYLVEYRIFGDTAWSSIQSQSPVEITDLPYSSKIEYRVTSNCSGNLGVTSNVFTAWTLCSLISDFPYLETFDTNVFVEIQSPMQANGTSLPCWFNVDGGSHYYYWSSITSGSGVNSSSALHFNGTTSTYSYDFSDWFISPIFELTGNERLNFEYKTILDENPPVIEVFAIDLNEYNYATMADTANFTLVATINTQYATTDQYNMVEVLLNEYSGSIRLALVVRQKSSTFYIDNFKISEMTPCPEVYGLTVNAAIQSATVNYNTANIIGEGVVLAYSPLTAEEFNPTLATTITIPADAPMPYTINGLTAGVTYNFAAQQACGGNWTEVLTVEIPNAYPVPLYFDFDTPETTPAMTFSTDSQENAWYIGIADNNTFDANNDLTAGGALYISNDNGVTAGYTDYGSITNAAEASFLVYLTPMAGRNLSFDVKIGGETYTDYLSVFLVPYGQTIDYSYMLEGFLCETPNWETKTIAMPTDYSGLYSLVFRWTNNFMDGSQPGAIIDNLKITQPNCNTSFVNWEVSATENANGVMTLVVNLTDTQNTGATYALTYKQANENNYTEVNGLTANDFPYTISTGIDFQTTYNVQLSLLCLGEDALLVGETSVITPCQSIPVPWFEDFATSPYNSGCWERYTEPVISNGVVHTSDLTPSNSPFCWGYISIFACGTTASAMIRSEMYYGANNWVITPIIDLGESTTKQISFDIALRDYTSNSFPIMTDFGKVMLLVSLDNGATWDKANGLRFVDGDSDTVHNYSSLTNEMQRFSYKLVDENDIPLTGKVRFAFYSESPSAFIYNWLCVDNIAVEEWSECPAPYGVLASGVTSNSAIVSFQAEEDATLWEYVIVTGNGENANFNSLTPTQISATALSLTGLTFSTEYTVAIRTICGNSHSPWTTVSFTTLAAIESVPYSTSFDDPSDASTWFFTQNSNPNRWAIGTATATEEGGTAAYISNDNGATYSASLAAGTTLAYIWKDFAFGETTNSFELSFDWKIRGRSTGAYCGIIVYLTDLVTPPTNALPADSDALVLLYGSDEWTNKTIFLGNVTGNKRLVILSFGYSSPEELIIPAAIDNISIDEVVCTPPTSEISVSDVTSNSATIAWQDDVHTSWKVYYKTFAETTYSSISVATPTATLTELVSDAAYYVYVTAICDTEESSPSQEITFRTGCAPLVAPFDYDFESFSGSLCWIKTTGLLGETVIHEGTSYWNPSTNDIDGNTTLKLRNNVYGANEKDWLITPQIDLGESGALYQVAIDVALTKYGVPTGLPDYTMDDRFAIVVSEDGGATWSNANALIYANGDFDSEHNYSDFIPSFTRVSFELRDEEGNPLTGLIKVAFYTESTIDEGADNDLYIDNLSIELVNEAPEIQPCDAPTALSANNITATTAEISWNGTADAYEIKVNSGATETLTATSKVLTDLLPETLYMVEVRAICETQTSEWVSTTFTTLSEEVVSPTIVTLPATNITHSSAEFSAEVTAGSEEITAQGFMYKATSSEQWITLNSTIGEYMTETVEGLEAEITYEFKAFATTLSGTFEGNVRTFTTLAGLNDALANTISATIYPNPANTTATLKVEGIETEAKIVISDLQGRILSQGKMEANTTTYTLDLSKMASGVYYIKLITDEAISTQKLIVE